MSDRAAMECPLVRVPNLPAVLHRHQSPPGQETKHVSDALRVVEELGDQLGAAIGREVSVHASV